MLLLVVGAVSGAPMRDLLRRSRHFTRGCTDERLCTQDRHGGSFGGGGGGRGMLYPVRCIARSGRINVLAMLRIINVCSRDLSSVATSVAETHLITHSNHLQL